jgi:hypothetical protein
VGKDTYNGIEALGAVLTIDGVIRRRLGQAWNGQLDSVLTWMEGNPLAGPIWVQAMVKKMLAGSWPNKWPSLGLEINRKKTALKSGDEKLGDVCRLLFGASKMFGSNEGRAPGRRGARSTPRSLEPVLSALKRCVAT